MATATRTSIRTVHIHSHQFTLYSVQCTFYQGTIVPAQVGGGAAQTGYRAVIYIIKFSAHFYEHVLVLYYIMQFTS